MRKSYLDGVPMVRKNGCFDGEKKGISTVLEQWEKQWLNAKKKGCFDGQKKCFNHV